MLSIHACTTHSAVDTVGERVKGEWKWCVVRARSTQGTFTHSLSCISLLSVLLNTIVNTVYTSMLIRSIFAFSDRSDVAVVTCSHGDASLLRTINIARARGSMRRRLPMMGIRGEYGESARNTKPSHAHKARRGSAESSQPAEWECRTARVHNATPYRLIQFDSLWYGVHCGVYLYPR